MSVERPAVFFDRDGTLIHEVNFCASPTQVKVYEGTVEALQKLIAAGFALVIITNQSGIGRGYFTHEDYEAVHREVLRQLEPIQIAGAYFDDSTPDRPSERRKPSPKMVEEAASELRLALTRSYFVGDRTGDIECGKNAGVRTVLVETGYGKKHLACGADAVVPDVIKAVDWILKDKLCQQ